jgi:hypothetical protein
MSNPFGIFFELPRKARVYKDFAPSSAGFLVRFQRIF